MSARKAGGGSALLSKHGGRLFVILFFAALLLIGLFTCGDYGVPCDEHSEQVILRENMKEYALQLLGDSSAAARYYDRLGVNRISQSLEKDHGQSAYYPMAALLPMEASAPHVLHTLWHAYTWLWFMAGCLALYGFCREMGWNRFVACITTLLLYLSPRFFAEGHYNNKDMVLLVLVLLCLWLGLRLLKKPCLLRGVLFSLAGAMAANTKIAGMVAWGLVSLAALVLITARKEWSLAMLRVALGTLVSFGVFYALLTPSLWQNPGEYLAYLLQNASGFTRWPGVVVFRGAVVDQAVQPLPRIYLPYMMLVTLPLYTLPMAALGQLTALGRWVKAKASALRDGQTLMLPVLTLVWLLPLGYALLSRPLVYNGWRHFYFVYAGLVLLAGQGLAGLSIVLQTRATLRRVGVVLLCLCFSTSAVGITLNHPYQYGYYNLLARSGAQRNMELDYWDVSTLNAMRMLLTVPRNTQLPLVLGAQEPMSLFGIVHGHRALSPAQQERVTVLPDESDDAPYLFSNTTYARIYGTAPPQGYHVLFSIQSYGNILATLYEKDP